MTALPGKPASNSVQSGQEQLLAVSPGERLQKARKERELDIAQVAESLNLSPGVVRSLEADDYRILPNATFVKGYLRSYARLLGISGDDLVRAYEAITGHVQDAKVEPVAPAMVSDKRAGMRNGVIAFVAVVVVGLGVWLSLSGDGNSQPASGTQVAESQEPPVAAEAADNPRVIVSRTGGEPAELQAEAEAVAEPPLPDESVSALQPEPAAAVAEPAAAVQAVAESAPAVVTSQAPVAAESVPVAQPEPVAPAAADRASGLVNLRFSGECWVEVRDGSGDLVFSSLKRAGQEVNLRAATPINVKLGNGDVVAVQYNHEPVAFTTRPDRKVVRLTLGE